MKIIKTIKEFEQLKKQEDILLTYFSHDRCNVCKVLLPKVKDLVNKDFPRVNLAHCNTEHAPELAAQNSIFTAPAIIIFVQGKEYKRISRNIGLMELAQYISRPYQMVFED